jgi:GNAT superfamily N-acetyltransferase
VTPDDRVWIKDILIEAWSSTRVVSRGIVHPADELPGIIAMRDDERIGLLTYKIDDSNLEIVTLNVIRKREGIGAELIQKAEEIALKHKCSRIWVVTTNDNKEALTFYQALDFHIAAVHENAIEVSRKLKPDIPLVGINGISITDEIVLEKILE